MPGARAASQAGAWLACVITGLIRMGLVPCTFGLSWAQIDRPKRDVACWCWPAPCWLHGVALSTRIIYMGRGCN